MDRNTREELNSLSKEVFGSSSRWQKFVNKGVSEPFERDREVMIPKANGQFVKKTFTDKKSIVRRYSVEEVRKLMVDIKNVRTSGIESPVGRIEVGPSINLPITTIEEGQTVQLPDGSTATVTNTK